jgi:hypothetical protein
MDAGSRQRKPTEKMREFKHVRTQQQGLSGRPGEDQMSFTNGEAMNVESATQQDRPLKLKVKVKPMAAEPIPNSQSMDVDVTRYI